MTHLPEKTIRAGFEKTNRGFWCSRKKKRYRVVGCTTLLPSSVRLLLFVPDVEARREEANCWRQVVCTGVRNPVNRTRSGMGEWTYGPLLHLHTQQSTPVEMQELHRHNSQLMSADFHHRLTELGSEEMTRTSKESG
jgi:hypothetical protein